MFYKAKVAVCPRDTYKTHKRNVSAIENCWLFNPVVRMAAARLWKVKDQRIRLNESLHPYKFVCVCVSYCSLENLKAQHCGVLQWHRHNTHAKFYEWQGIYFDSSEKKSVMTNTFALLKLLKYIPCIHMPTGMFQQNIYESLLTGSKAEIRGDRQHGGPKNLLT
jgi:hypothetical protein